MVSSATRCENYDLQRYCPLLMLSTIFGHDLSPFLEERKREINLENVMKTESVVSFVMSRILLDQNLCPIALL